MKNDLHRGHVRYALGLVVLLTLGAFVGAVAEAPRGALLDPPIDELQDAGIAKAPEWRPGDWWQVEVEDFLRGDRQEFTLVVLAANASGYVVGATDPAAIPTLLLFHVPFVGEVGRGLDWMAHEQRAELVRFPLRGGDQWDTFVEGEPVRVAVERADRQMADLLYVRPDGSRLGTATYDATMGTIERYDYSGFMESHVVRHGVGFAGTVYAPARVTSLIGSFWSADAVQWDATGTAPRSVPVRAPVEYAGFMLMVRAQSAGVYRSRVVLPDGRAFESSLGPADAQTDGLSVQLTREPVGEWTVEQQVLGLGMSWIEAIGYDLVIDRVDPVPCLEDCMEASSLSSTPSPSDGARAPWIGAGVGLGLLSLWIWAWPRARPFALALFARLTRAKALDQATRRTILQLLEADPGLTTQEIRRRLDLGWGTVVHHLDVLRQLGFVDVVQWGRDRDYFPRGFAAATERALISALRRQAPGAVLKAIRRGGERSQLEVARELGVHHGTVAYHARRLAQLGLLRIERQGGRVRYVPTV
jgi:predicted transcriptional regulator